MKTQSPSVLFRLVGDQAAQKNVAALLLVTKSDNWIGRFVAGLLRTCEHIGLEEMLQDPDRVLSMLESDLEQLQIDLDHARTLNRLYPKLLAADAAPEPPASEVREAA